MRNKSILLISLLIGGGLSIFASSFPDGLEKVAEEQGFLGKAIAGWPAPFPDYLIPNIANNNLALALAGLIGTMLVFAAIYLSVLIINRKKV
jgi:cobalt/nickel transport protein